MTPRSAIRHNTTNTKRPYSDDCMLDVLEKEPVTRYTRSTVATADVQPQHQEFTPRKVKFYKEMQQQPRNADTEDNDVLIYRDDTVLQPKRTTGPQSMIARKQSALKNRVDDRRTTGSYPAQAPQRQVHRQRQGRFTIRNVFAQAREGSRPILIGLTMLLIILVWLTWNMGTGIAHWYSDNQYKASGSTHGAMAVAYLGDGDSPTNPDTVYALLKNGQVLLITGNNPAKMHIYAGVILSKEKMISDEISLSLTISDTNNDGKMDVEIDATDWAHLGSRSIGVIFINDGKGGFKGGQ